MLQSSESMLVVHTASKLEVRLGRCVACGSAAGEAETHRSSIGQLRLPACHADGPLIQLIPATGPWAGDAGGRGQFPPPPMGVGVEGGWLGQTAPRPRLGDGVRGGVWLHQPITSQIKTK